jgi:putative membrane protein insertion efficiency factor
VKRSLPTRGLLQTLNLYQRLSAHRPSPCRYIPSCSEYAREALESHGAARGTWLSARRLSRCHPFGGFGFDPVPPRETAVPGRS